MHLCGPQEVQQVQQTGAALHSALGYNAVALGYIR